MNILFSIPYFEPAWGYGGPPRIVSELTRELAKRHTIRIITTDVLDEKNRIKTLWEKEGNREIFRYRTMSNTLAWKTKIILPIGLKHSVADHVEWADFVYLSDLRHALNAYIFPVLQKTEKPYALAAFGQIQKPKDIKYPLKILYDALIGKKIITKATALLAQTNNEAQDYETIGGKPEQIHIIPLGEKTPPQKNESDKENFRKKYGIEPNEKILLFVGRINKLKGIDTLVEAFMKIPSELQSTTRLVIVGRDDGYQQELEKLIEQKNIRGRVIETGPLYGEENAGAYQAADLFVFTPNFYEETSLAAVRAISFGVPVITVPQAEMPYLDEMGAGTTEKNDARNIADAITNILQDSKKLENMKRSAEKLFLEHYTIESIAKKIETIAENSIKTRAQNIDRENPEVLK